jgi:hypothetical protein
MKNQTAVDMFCSIIADHIEAIFNGSIEQDEFAKRMRQTYDQAKAMEKEQIMDIDYRLSIIEDYAKGEAGDEITKLRKYIDETYGK